MNENKNLTDDELWFAISCGLPLKRSEYSELEYLKLKEKATQEKIKYQLKMQKRKQDILFG